MFLLNKYSLHGLTFQRDFPAKWMKFILDTYTAKQLLEFAPLAMWQNHVRAGGLEHEGVTLSCCTKTISLYILLESAASPRWYNIRPSGFGKLTELAY
jgi:hypothetical protein